ncbi:MAG: pyridoxal kinase PdxY [Treponema sp.]|jgi:pyridoxine kinase|nr:pyridoxal kinase PdxY [Treponema sp.]
MTIENEAAMAVLSIQSHVVYGYAGNTAAVFPLQRLGREVWAINTVEFSNHTGYGAWRGKVLGAELAADLVTGLEERGVLGGCEAVLSGYLGDAAVGRAVIDAVRRVRKEAPGAIYCCDPVMGDMGRGFYVKPDIPDMFKNELLPLADIVTPNQFELEALTSLDTGGIDKARRAIEMLHEKGPGIVLVTSYRDGEDGAGKGGPRISMLASDKTGGYRISTPELPLGAIVAGSGDLTASVFLSRYLETKDIKRTLELCTAAIYGILEASFLKRNGAKTNETTNSPLELAIIHNQHELNSPSHTFEAICL